MRCSDGSHVTLSRRIDIERNYFICRMDTATRFKWNVRICSGNGDELKNRVGCSATLVGHYIWVLGGSKSETRVSVLDTASYKWREVTVNLYSLELLKFHAAKLFEDKILVVGARRRYDDQRLGLPGDFYGYDLVTNELVHLPIHNERDIVSSWRIRAGELYTPSSTLAFVCGREKEQDQVHLRLKLLNLETMTWSVPQTQGRGPVGWSRTTVTSCLGGSRMFVHSTPGVSGGWASLGYIDLAAKRKYVWTEVTGLGERIYRTGPSLEYIGKGKLIIYGGNTELNLNGTEALSIIDYANSKKPMLHTVNYNTPSAKYDSSGIPPPLRPLALTVLMSHKLVVLGGAMNAGSSIHEMIPRVSMQD